MSLIALMRSSLDRVTAAASWLVLPLALLLFAQWPLRDLVGAGSREANDLAQCLFALYVAMAVRQATRSGSHLAAHGIAERLPEPVRALLARAGHSLAVLPFALYLIASGSGVAWNSLRALEAFPDTFNPGYFIVKAAAWLLAWAMALEAVLELFSPARDAAQ